MVQRIQERYDVHVETVQTKQIASTPDTFLQGVKDCIPTLLGYISIGFAFGVVATASDISLLEVFLLSFLVYAGSAQFIFCGLYIAGAPASVIILTIFIVNLRHLLMSLTVAPSFTNYSTLRNVGFGTLLTDETFGVAVTALGREGRLGGRWMDGLNITAYSTWIVSCCVGAIAGKWVPDAEKWGLDYALVAMFVALLILNLINVGKGKVVRYIKLIVVLGVIYYALLYVVPSHVAVLLSTIIVATIGVMTE